MALFTCWTAIHLNKKILHLSGKIMNDLLIDFWWRSKHSVARFTVKVSNAWNRSVVFSDRLVKLNTKPHTKKQEIRTTRRLAIEFRKPFMTVSRFYVRRAGRFFLFSVTIKSLCFFWASLQVCHSCIIYYVFYLGKAKKLNKGNWNIETLTLKSYSIKHSSLKYVLLLFVG